MKTKLPLILALMVGVLTVLKSGAADCDCTRVPFTPDPPCFKTCTAKLLAQIKKKDDLAKIGIPAQTADKIFSFPDRKTAKSIDDYKSILTTEEMDAVVECSKNLSQDTLDAIKHHKTDSVVPKINSQGEVHKDKSPE